jgi:hypothetical protein
MDPVSVGSETFSRILIRIQKIIPDPGSSGKIIPDPGSSGSEGNLK